MHPELNEEVYSSGGLTALFHPPDNLTDLSHYRSLAGQFPVLQSPCRSEFAATNFIIPGIRWSAIDASLCCSFPEIPVIFR